ncbi:MAG TPA: hypothetical protein PLQ49_02930, partial [Methanothrix sp.]|nr:hypothetical protein [Methanothrix sp.]
MYWQKPKLMGPIYRRIAGELRALKTMPFVFVEGAGRYFAELVLPGNASPTLHWDKRLWPFEDISHKLRR